MSALEQEVLALYWRLDKDARQRVLEQIRLELETNVTAEEERVNAQVLDTEQDVTQPTPEDERQ